MHEKNIKLIIRKQIKKNHPDWKRLSKKKKKSICKDICDAVLSEYNFKTEIDKPIEQLIGIDDQQPDSRIMNLSVMANFIENFYWRSGLLNFEQHRQPWPEIINKELQFIDQLLDNRIINSLLANDGYSPQMRDIFPCQLFRAELLKAIKYPEISYRKFCTPEYMGQERKENRRFLSLPLNTKDIIDHTVLSHFRRSLRFDQLVNLLVYILHHFYKSGLLHNNMVHGVDSTEISNDNWIPLYQIEIHGKKIRIYQDIECDCGARRCKRDKSKFVVGYRLHTLTAINPATKESFPLVSLLGPANHHDSLYLKPLVRLAQSMGIEVKLITADEAYHDKDGSMLEETEVHLITPASSAAGIPAHVDPQTLAVTCNDYCEIPMKRMGSVDEGHEYKCNADAGECSRSGCCQQFRIIPFDNGHFQRMPGDKSLAQEAIDIRKNIERPFNLLKKREGLENARVRSQEALAARCVFATIATLLIEMAGTRKKEKKNIEQMQLPCFAKAA